NRPSLQWLRDGKPGKCDFERLVVIHQVNRRDTPTRVALLCFAEQGGQTFGSRGLYSRHDSLGFVGATVEAPVFVAAPPATERVGGILGNSEPAKTLAVGEAVVSPRRSQEHRSVRCDGIQGLPPIAAVACDQWTDISADPVRARLCGLFHSS